MRLFIALIIAMVTTMAIGAYRGAHTSSACPEDAAIVTSYHGAAHCVTVEPGMEHYVGEVSK